MLFLFIELLILNFKFFVIVCVIVCFTFGIAATYDRGKGCSSVRMFCMIFFLFKFILIIIKYVFVVFMSLFMFGLSLS